MNHDTCIASNKHGCSYDGLLSRVIREEVQYVKKCRQSTRELETHC